MRKIKNPKYNIGEKVMYSKDDEGGGTIWIKQITSLYYVQNHWIYYFDDVWVSEEDIIKKIK